MSGPNFILDKGYVVAAAATNVTFGRICKFSSTAGTTVTTSAAPAAAAAADLLVGVYQDTVDAAKVATGKHVINVRLMGISRVIAGGVVAAGDRITSDATGRGIAATATAGASKWVIGVALTPAAAANDHFDCVIMIGDVLTNGGT